MNRDRMGQRLQLDKTVNRYKLSLEWYEEAKNVTPGGAQTLSKMPKRFPFGSFPIAVERGDGARVQDIDGNWYVDWINAMGAVTLGYQHPHVVDSIGRQLKDGVLFGLPHRIERDISLRLTKVIPCAESVRWFKTGSEATQAAIRTARIATGREMVLTVGDGYHGWHSWFLAVKPWHPGVPKAYEELIKAFRYNDLSSLEVQLERYGTRTAAVILEPCHFEIPTPGFLQGVRELCNRHRTVLIFDEIVTGFRWALGGGQEYFGVVPDLATFGKAAANGLPIAMLCGQKDFMSHAELVQGGTFGGDALSLVACNAVLDVYQKEPVIENLWTRGRELQKQFNETAKQLNLDAIIEFFPYTESSKANDDSRRIFAMSLFLQEAAAAGVLFHPVNCNVSAVLTDKDMKTTFRAIKVALRAVARALEHDDWAALTGHPIQSVMPLRS